MLWGYAVTRLGPSWYGNADYNFGWFVPVFCACLFWERWKCRPSQSPVHVSKSAALGSLVASALLLPGCLFLEIIPAWRLAGWTFATAVVGITLTAIYLIGGRRWLWHFAPPVLLVLVAVPWPTRVEVPLVEELSGLNAMVSTWLANLLGTPAVRKGILIETGAGLVGVDEACSGIRSFQASVTVALLMGELFRYGPFSRILFLAGGVATAFIGNVARTTYLVRVCDLRGLDAVNLQHDQAGLVILGTTLVALLVLAWLLRPRVRATKDTTAVDTTTRPPEEASRASGMGRPVLANGLLAATAVWIILSEAGMACWFQRAERVASSSANWSVRFPEQSPRFQTGGVSDAIRKKLGCDNATMAEWSEVNGRPWKVYYLRWHAAPNAYRALAAGGSEHSLGVCLGLLGMSKQEDLGLKLTRVNGVTLLTQMQRYWDRGRRFHILWSLWDSAGITLDKQPVRASTQNALRRALRGVATGDRGRTEKRVFEMGVWGMETDEEAATLFRQQLEQMIVVQPDR